MPNRINAYRKHRRMHEQGATLIEVLIAMFILSFGLLGIAGLQAGVAKYKINTWARSAASGLLPDLADRIRVNSDVAGSNFITGLTADSQYLLNTTWAAQQSAALTMPNPNCESSACTTTERAAYDMMAWRNLVRASLPQGSALVTGNRRDGVQVTLMWFDKGFTEAQRATDDGTTATSANLLTTEACTAAMTGMRRQSCCPAAAAVPAGVRCINFSFTP